MVVREKPGKGKRVGLLGVGVGPLLEGKVQENVVPWPGNNIEPFHTGDEDFTQIEMQDLLAYLRSIHAAH